MAATIRKINLNSNFECIRDWTIGTNLLIVIDELINGDIEADQFLLINVMIDRMFEQRFEYTCGEKV